MIAHSTRKPLSSMNPRWKNFLLEAGAILGADHVAHFGNPRQELQVATSGGSITPLVQRGLIAAQGADAMKFLQGQFTNDVAKVDAAHSQLSGYCSPKGRLLALFRLFFRDGCYYLDLPAALLAPTLERLKKYTLMSKVVLQDAGDAMTGIGCAGPRIVPELERLIGELPQAVDDVLQADTLTVIRLPGIQPRFAVYGPIEAIEKIWSALDVHAAPAGTDAWTRLDILAGIPDVHPATVEEFIPQTVNLDLLDGINFKKGCYTGQEIIARLHYRGTVKRRMYIAHSPADDRPGPGAPLLAEGGDDQAVGNVVSAAPDPEGGHDLLIVAATEYLSDNILYLKDNPANRLTLTRPAYMPAGE